MVLLINLFKLQDFLVRVYRLTRLVVKNARPSAGVLMVFVCLSFVSLATLYRKKKFVLQVSPRLRVGFLRILNQAQMALIAMAIAK
jgi:hypothetical protein